MIQLCRHFGSHLECQTVACQVRKHVRDGHRKYDRSGARALFVRLLSKERDHEKSEKQQEQGLEDEEQKGGHELESPPSPSPGKPAAGSEELGKQPMTESMTMGRRLRGRPLSPFQRVTGFMPPDFWKSKAADLGAFEMESTQKPNSETESAAETLKEQNNRINQGHKTSNETEGSQVLEDHHMDKERDDLRTKDLSSTGISNLFPFDLNFNLPNFKVFKSPLKQLPLKVGEPIMAELKEQKEVQHFRKMWILDERRKVNSKYGMVLFEDIIGKNPGDTYVTSTGTEMIIRRPSLEEFTLYMKKIAAIPHPKNNNTALCLLDVSPGDWVLECGTGSGAMTLFLSRAVGVTGRVISFEIKQDHLNRAKRNYRLWIDSWKLSHETDWPDNVTFHHADVINATDKVRHQLDGAFLDMLTPNIGLRAVLPLIKPGKVIACHIVNMTQVVDLVASILKHQLPVVVEQVLEVEHKNWLVTPAQHYTGRLINKPGSPSHGEVSSDEEQGSSSEEEGNGGQITEDTAFLARPAIKQDSHTGFLMKLRVYSDTKHARCTT
ncbi:PREDICTED: tRNA (adenine(58)-N(1))-methyltransferase, mitochondrial-like [Branchiostoma belcheri]|uniref:tRNA (adenine(58)-N(1))-methyltransferase n=1 Tax=Branchiostoma belcheri TaxID=7741 RepID=A0A6P4Z8B0_BRABE|nr:PREDICTED: tRNA (adenine(58)-N(1))-methyltransferase, mitochondrial-like [Branchiostoma belcheri]